MMMIGGRFLRLAVASVLLVLTWAARPLVITEISADQVIKAWPNAHTEMIAGAFIPTWETLVRRGETQLYRAKSPTLLYNGPALWTSDATATKRYDYETFANVVGSLLAEFRKIMVSIRRMAMGGLSQDDQERVSVILRISGALRQHGTSPDFDHFPGLVGAGLESYRLAMNTFDYFASEYAGAADRSGLYRQILNTKVFSDFLAFSKKSTIVAERWEEAWTIFDECLGALEDINIQISLLTTLSSLSQLIKGEASKVLLTQLVESHIGPLRDASIRLNGAFESLHLLLRPPAAKVAADYNCIHQRLLSFFCKPARFLFSQLLAEKGSSAGTVKDSDMERLFDVLPSGTRSKLQRVLAYQYNVRDVRYNRSCSIREVWKFGFSEQVEEWSETMITDLYEALYDSEWYSSFEEIPADASEDWVKSQSRVFEGRLERCPWKWRSTVTVVDLMAQFGAKAPGFEDYHNSSRKDVEGRLWDIGERIAQTFDRAMSPGFSQQARDEVLYRIFKPRLGHVFGLFDRYIRTWSGFKSDVINKWRLTGPRLDQSFLEDSEPPQGAGIAENGGVSDLTKSVLALHLQEPGIGRQPAP